MSLVRLSVRVVMNNEVACISKSDHISYFVCILGYQDVLFHEVIYSPFSKIKFDSFCL